MVLVKPLFGTGWQIILRRAIFRRACNATHGNTQMSKRYGIIVKQDDGTEVVSNILEKEGGPPFPGSDNAQVIADLDPRVKIGMVRGGKGEAAAGFGWNTEATPPPKETTDEERAEAKKEAARARLEEAKGDDNFAERHAADEAAEKAAAKKADKAAADKAAAAKKNDK